jgi:predicted ATPase/DNA-binding CsgD family transcriptional regulator
VAKGLKMYQTDNLPAPISTFIGREHEITNVKQLILAHRLVTLTGAGGSGKTRLALEAARNLRGVFKHGIWFIELASLTDASLIPQTLVSTVDIRELPGQSYLDSLQAYFSVRQLLLVIDNCEHLIAACAEVSDILLQKCPDLRILTTSREVLGIIGEAAYTVPPLTLPDPQPWKSPAGAEAALKQYEHSESVQLFVTRAITNSREFKLTVHNGARVAEICRRLDGMPLAIELAAAHVRSLSVQEIAQRLDHRFQLLIGGGRLAHPRQQTLLSTLDWSYDLLSVSEQKMLQRLAVFAGGATLEAAEKVCAGEDVDADEVQETISRLVDKSLVIAGRSSRGKVWYRLLESIRDYALEKLVAANEKADVQDKHLDYYLQLVEEAEVKLRGSEQADWLKMLEDENDNVRAALSWAIESQNANAGLMLVCRISFFWGTRGYLKEGKRWMEKALELKHLASVESVANALKVFAIMQRTDKGRDLNLIGNLLEESLKLYQELDDKNGIADVLNFLGIHALAQDDYTKAKEHLNASLALRRELGDPWGIAHTLQNFAPVALQEHDYESAKAYAEETIAWFERAGDRRGVTRTLIDFAEIAAVEDDYPLAMRLLYKTLSHLLEIGDIRSFVSALGLLAMLESKQGNHVRAAPLFGASETLRESIDMMPLQDLEFEDYERSMDVTQQELSEKAFTQLWESGRAMTLEQVLDFVLHKTAAPAPVEIKKEQFGGLTARECETAILIAEGKSNREVAEAMTVSMKTVESYITRIRRKLGFDSRVQIATWVIDKNIHRRSL